MLEKTKTVPFRLEEATIDDLHAAIRSGATNVVAVVQHYLARVRAYNGGGTNFGGNQMFTTIALPPSAPTALTLAASGVASNAATLNGTINPNGNAASGYFEWGTNVSYGSITALQSAGAGNGATALNAALTGLVASHSPYAPPPFGPVPTPSNT